MTEPNRHTLRSKLLEATNVQRAENRFRKISKAEWDDIFDPCRWREPVFAWLLANWEQVFKARTHLELSARLEWKDIARIAELDGVKGSRGEPPNANSVRRVWDGVVSYLERQAEQDMRTTQASGVSKAISHAFLIGCGLIVRLADEPVQGVTATAESRALTPIRKRNGGAWEGRPPGCVLP